MISNKTAVALFLITLGMKIVTSTNSSDTQEPSSSNRPALLVKKQRSTPKAIRNVLLDTSSIVSPVEVQMRTTETLNTLQEQPVDRTRNGPGFLETLMDRGQYDRVCYFARRIGTDKFLKRIYPLVKTLRQYNGLAGYLKRRKMVASFYVYGNIEVVKRVIVKSRVYADETDYVDNGDLETALDLAFKEDLHNRVIALFAIRQEATAEKDKELERMDEETSFESFVYDFLENFFPWDDSMTIKRFLTLSWKEFNSKYSDIYEIFCIGLVLCLSIRDDSPDAKKLLIDLIGQPFLLKLTSFDGFSETPDTKYSTLIEYGWREAIKEALDDEPPSDYNITWQAITCKLPNQVHEGRPPTEDELDAILKNFPTKQDREEQWAKENAVILFNKLQTLQPIFTILPDVLWSIVAEYAILWLDIDDSTVPEE